MKDGFIWALLIGAVGRFIGLLESRISFVIAPLRPWSATPLLHLWYSNIFILKFLTFDSSFSATDRLSLWAIRNTEALTYRRRLLESILHIRKQAMIFDVESVEMVGRAEIWTLGVSYRPSWVSPPHPVVGEGGEVIKSRPQLAKYLWYPLWRGPEVLCPFRQGVPSEPS